MCLLICDHRSQTQGGDIFKRFNYLKLFKFNGQKSIHPKHYQLSHDGNSVTENRMLTLSARGYSKVVCIGSAERFLPSEYIFLKIILGVWGFCNSHVYNAGTIKPGNEPISSICYKNNFKPDLMFESTGTTLTLQLVTDDQVPRRGFVAIVQGIDNSFAQIT